jgi:hypothetical protein
MWVGFLWCFSIHGAKAKACAGHFHFGVCIEHRFWSFSQRAQRLIRTAGSSSEKHLVAGVAFRDIYHIFFNKMRRRIAAVIWVKHIGFARCTFPSHPPVRKRLWRLNSHSVVYVLDRSDRG